MADPRIKKLQIQTGVLKRVAKEKTSYEKELIREQERLAKFISDGGDEHVIRKQEEVISETEMIIPDCAKRIKNAIEALSKLITESENDLHENEQFIAAKTALSEISNSA